MPCPMPCRGPRARVWLGAIAITAFLAPLGIAAAPAAMPDAANPREAAVLQARAGQVDAALAALRAMLAAGTRDRLVAMDLTTLLQQHGHVAEAAAVFAQAADPAPPAYALMAAIRANRDIGQFARAARLARVGRSQFGDPDFALLEALALADAGQGAAAMAVLQSPDARRARALDRDLATAYAARRMDDRWTALRAYAQAARLAPGNQEARDGMAAMLRDLGAPYRAASIGGQSLALRATQAGMAVRWGEQIQPGSPAQRFALTDAALARLDAALADAQAAKDPDPALIRQLRLDRMVALRDRVRMREVVQEADALAQQAALPGYAREAEADARLYLQQPEAAGRLYRALLAEDPANMEAAYGAFYAAVEAEDFDDAYRRIDALAAGQEKWRYFAGDPTRYANGEYQRALLAQGMARFYGNQVAQAWRQVAPMAQAAPGAQDLRLADAALGNAMGWPRAADAAIAVAASLAPDTLAARQAQAEAAISRTRPREAAARVASLLADYPENRGVQRLARDWDAAGRALLEAEAGYSHGEGGGNYNDGNEITSSARLTSPAWRGDDAILHVFALMSYADAKPPEGFISRTRGGLGLSSQWADMSAQAYVTASAGSFARGGGGGAVDYAPDDHWSFSLEGELYAQDTPLRALRQGVRADMVALSAAYAIDAATRLRASASVLPFTDGNLRASYSASLSHLLWVVPHFDLTGRAEIYAQTNSGAPDAFYYNPKASVAPSLGLTAQQVIWRRYDRSFVHSLSVDGGYAAERGFSGGFAGSIAYEQRWRFDPMSEFYYGVSFLHRIYDGSGENSLAATLGLRQRF